MINSSFKITKEHFLMQFLKNVYYFGNTDSGDITFVIYINSLISVFKNITRSHNTIISPSDIKKNSALDCITRQQP